MKRIAAVVVTFNRKELLAQCLECLNAQQVETTDVAFDILVVDNASTDGTSEMFSRGQQDNVRYFNTGSNLGGAGGFNFGMKKALEEGYDYLWVMDDDCLPEPDALQALLAADCGLQGQWGFLSSVVRWTDGSICCMNVQRHPLFHNISDFDRDMQPCTLASFVSLFVSASTVREVGLPIKEFFIWTDDWEFTRRISRRYPCYVVGASRVTHASATNGAGNIYTDPATRLDRYQYVYRNDVVLYRQEGIRGKAYLVVRAFYHMLRVLCSSVGQKRRRLALIAQGNLEGARFHPRIEFPEAVGSGASISPHTGT